jgi:hypothetical protein
MEATVVPPPVGPVVAIEVAPPLIAAEATAEFVVPVAVLVPARAGPVGLAGPRVTIVGPIRPVPAAVGAMGPSAAVARPIRSAAA